MTPYDDTSVEQPGRTANGDGQRQYLLFTGISPPCTRHR